MTTCSVNACDKPAVGRGWCASHYERWRSTGDIQENIPLQQRPRPSRELGVCSVNGCDRGAKTRNWCQAHYQRWLATGDVQEDRPISGDTETLDRGGYLKRWQPSHPVAMPSGAVFSHRVVLYAKIGPGEHSCHWCGEVVSWEITYPTPGALVTDHLDNCKTNNDPSNLVPSCQPCNSSRAHKKLAV